MSRDLASLHDWLLELGVTHVGMEGTGVYWRPVHAALEGAFTVIVGNASHMRDLPGRETDVRDAEWIADLVRHGLVRASFVPPSEVRVLRDLVRHRKALVGGLAAERNRERKRRGTRKGDPYPEAALVTAAISAARAKGTYLRDKLHRLRARLEAKKAAMAVAHEILVAVFHILERAVPFADLGPDYLDRLDKHRTAKRLLRRLGALGYDIMLRPKAAT
jgi:hypothetical protein